METSRRSFLKLLAGAPVAAAAITVLPKEKEEKLEDAQPVQESFPMHMGMGSAVWIPPRETPAPGDVVGTQHFGHWTTQHAEWKVQRR